MADQLGISRRRLMQATAGIVGSFLVPGTAVFADDGRSVSVRIDREVKNLDPPFRTGQVDGNIIRAVFQRLISYKSSKFEWELDAAESIEQISPTEIAFRLKKAQHFTDGYGEMTAEDVKFSFERYLTPDANGNVSSYRDDWGTLKEVKIHDTYSGSLIFTKPTPSVWQVALVGGSGVITSKKAVEALGAKHSQSPVGSGPYRVESLQPQRGLVLVSNKDFKAYQPAFDVCRLQYIANPKTAELALQSKEINFTELSLSAANQIKSEDTVVTKRPSMRFVWLGMNMERAPLDNLAVRQAVKLALDVDQMILAGYQGDAGRLNSMIPPGATGHWEDAPVYQRDIEKARALLGGSGVTLPIKLKLTILNEPAFQNMALVAQALLAEVGIVVDIDQREGATFWSSGKGASGAELEMFFLRFNAHIDPNFNTRWFLREQIGDWNWQRFNDAKFEELQEASLVNTDEKARIAQIIEMQKRMEESASMVWLTNDVFAFGTTKGLQPAVMPNGNDWQLNYFTAA